MDPVPTHTPEPSTRHGSSSTALLVIAWLIVGVPALWGVSKTVQKSLPLFTASSATTTQPGNASTQPATSPH